MSDHLYRILFAAMLVLQGLLTGCTAKQQSLKQDAPSWRYAVVLATDRNTLSHALPGANNATVGIGDYAQVVRPVCARRIGHAPVASAELAQPTPVPIHVCCAVKKFCIDRDNARCCATRGAVCP